MKNTTVFNITFVGMWLNLCSYFLDWKAKYSIGKKVKPVSWFSWFSSLTSFMVVEKKMCKTCQVKKSMLSYVSYFGLTNVSFLSKFSNSNVTPQITCKTCAALNQVENVDYSKRFMNYWNNLCGQTTNLYNQMKNVNFRKYFTIANKKPHCQKCALLNKKENQTFTDKWNQTWNLMYFKTTSWFTQNGKAPPDYQRCSYCKFMNDCNEYFNLIYLLKPETKMKKTSSTDYLKKFTSFSTQASLGNWNFSKQEKQESSMFKYFKSFELFDIPKA